MAVLMRWLAVPALLVLQALPAAEPVRLTDAELETMAKEAMVSSNAKLQASTLHQLQVHHFKTSLAKEREVALYAQGTLEDRLGMPARAAITFHKLEASWPNSPYLPETQVVMAQAALEHKRNKEAELRLRKALSADLPVESLRRSQELFLWCLADQGRASEGIETVNALKPLGGAKPSEKGLVGILEAFCAAHKRADALGAVTSYRQYYATGPHIRRVDLDWAKLLGTLGEAGASAQAFQKLIVAGPDSPEADEARLALATLLTDGRLSAKETQGLPTPTALLARLQKASLKDGPARQAVVVKLRVDLKEQRWQDAIASVTQLRALHPPESEALQASTLRMEAMRGWVQELLDKHQASPVLPYLDGEGIRCLTPAQRLGLAKGLAQMGLPEASSALMNVAPAAEKPALRKAILATTGSASPQSALAFLPDKGESAQESLTRAQAHAAQRDWPMTRTALAKAKAGPERMQVIMALLNRPADPKEAPGARLKEAEGWLSRAPEKGADREPLAIFAADLKTRAGDWHGALALYPTAPQPGNLGWVALMRATCLARLGQVAPAQAALQAAAADGSFKAEREALAQRLGR